MSLKSEIAAYTDSYGLVEPGPATPSTNGVCYTSEYIIALMRNGTCSPTDVKDYTLAMMRCMHTLGLLQRTPDNTGGQEGPDDYYALFAAIDEIDNPNARGLARAVIKYTIHHLGSLDNINPGKFQWGAFLGRQPQLDACALWAAGYFVGPVLRTIMCLSILANSFRPAGTNDTTSWRLQWLQVQVARRNSFICRLASILWYKALHKAWGPTGMRAVNSVYFQPEHPLAKYVADKAK
jgi:hypothetical protein